MRALLFAALVCGALAIAGTRASAAPARVGVARFSGPDEAVLRQGITKALRSRGYTVVGSTELTRAAGGGARLERSRDAGKAIHTLGLSGLVIGAVSGDARRRVARVRLHLPRGTTQDEVFTSDGSVQELAVTVERSFMRRFQTALASARQEAAPAAPRKPATKRTPRASRPVVEEAEAPPPEPAPAPPPATPAAVVAATAPEPLPPARAAIELSAGPRFFTRRFTYDGDTAGVLRDYRTTSPAPAFVLTASLFPVPSGPFRSVGAQAGLEYGLGLESKTREGLLYTSPARDVWFDLAARFPSPYVTTTVRLGAGQHSFSFTPVGDARMMPATVPNVSYAYTRIGLDGRVHASPTVNVLLGLSYRHVSSQGALASDDWLQELTSRGLDLGLGLALRLSRRWEARFQVDLRRYGHTARGEMAPASRVVDQYWSYSLSAATLLGGPR